LRGGAARFFALVTCGGRFKYSKPDTDSHAPTLHRRLDWCSSLRSGVSGVSHIRLEQSFGLLPSRVYLRRGLHFFIERWEREKGKPRFSISTEQHVWPEPLREIRVRLAPEKFLNHEARFFFVSVKNEGEKTAEEVVPLILVPEATDLLMPLVMIAPTGKPFITVAWPGAVEEFHSERSSFATALIHSEKTRKLQYHSTATGSRKHSSYSSRSKTRRWYISHPKASWASARYHAHSTFSCIFKRRTCRSIMRRPFRLM